MGHKQGRVTEHMEPSQEDRVNQDLLYAFHKHLVLSKLPVYLSNYKLRFLNPVNVLDNSHNNVYREWGGGGGGGGGGHRRV